MLPPFITEYGPVAGWAAGALTIAGILWKIARGVARTERAYPVMLEIAEQFRNNSGSTLKDAMDRTEKLAQDGVDVAGEARTAAEKSLAGVNKLVSEWGTFREELSKNKVARSAKNRPA